MKTQLGLVVAVAGLMASMIGCGQETEFVSIAGNPSGTPAYLWATGIADLASGELDSVNVTGEETGGYLNNAELFRDGEIEAGFTNSRIGLELYQEDIAQAWMNFASIEMHVVVPQDSEIETLDDLEDKRVGIGQPGGTSLMDAEEMIDVAGLTDEIDDFQMHVTDQVDMMKDGQLDVLIWNGSMPVPPVTDLATTMDVRFLDIPEEVVEGLAERSDAYGSRVIPTGTYEGQEEEVDTFGLQNILAVRQDLDDDTVYEMTKLILENRDELSNVHPAFGRMSADTVLEGLPMPAHPGAQRYFDEIGAEG